MVKTAGERRKSAFVGLEAPPLPTPPTAAPPTLLLASVTKLVPDAFTWKEVTEVEQWTRLWLAAQRSWKDSREFIAGTVRISRESLEHEV